MIWKILLLLALVGCTSGSVFSSETSDKDDDGRRPSEQGEGLEGYLLSPAAVAINDDGNQIQVIAAAGAVSHPNGDDPAGIATCFRKRADAQVIAAGVAQADGGFSLTADSSSIAENEAIYVGVATACTTDATVANSAFFAKIEGSFVAIEAEPALATGEIKIASGLEIEDEDDGFALAVCTEESEDCPHEVEIALETIAGARINDFGRILVFDPDDCSLQIVELLTEDCGEEENTFRYVEYGCGFDEATRDVDFEECLTEEEVEIELDRECMQACRDKAIVNVEYPGSRLFFGTGEFLIQGEVEEVASGADVFEIDNEDELTITLDEDF